MHPHVLRLPALTLPPQLQENYQSNNVACLGNQLLEEDIHHYQAIKKHFKQLNEEMEAIEDEMFRLQMQQHRCVTQPRKADAIKQIESEIEQHIQVVTLWEVKHGCLY